MPALIFSPRSRSPDPAERRLRPVPSATESEFPPTTAGGIFSARSWPRRSSRNSAMAKLQEDPRFAERFELYACGVELANGFGELTDPTLQRRRFEEAMAERLR